MPAQTRKKNRAIEKDLLALFPNGPRSVRDRDAGSRPIATLPSRRRDARTRPRGRDRRENAKTRKARESRGRFAFHSRTRGDAYLDLLRHEFDLVLGVRHAHEVAVRHEVERVARRAHLLVHLVPAADARVVVRVEHALVRPGVLRAVQPVLGLVRERDAREPEEGRGARAERGEPLLRGAPALRGKLPRARDRGARRGGRRRGSRARGLRRETKHAGGRPVGPSTRPAPVKCGARAVITTRWRGRVDDDADALKSRTGLAWKKKSSRSGNELVSA